MRDVVVYGVLAAFAMWCAHAFRSDIAQISLQPVLDAWPWIAAAALLSLVNYACRIVRWRVYLARLGFPLGARFAALTYTAGFAFTLSPGKVGELVRARYYRGLGISVPTVAAGFFVERLIDVFSVFLLALASFSDSPRYGVFLRVIAIALLVVLFTLSAVRWRPLDDAGGHRRPEHFWRRWQAQALRALAEARTLLRPGMLVLALVLALVGWGAEGAGLKLISAIAPTVSLEWTRAIGIYAIATLVGAFSFLPGGLGSTEAVMVALLTAYGFGLPDSILITLVCRVCTLWLAVAAGWICVLALRRTQRAAVAK